MIPTLGPQARLLQFHCDGFEWLQGEHQGLFRGDGPCWQFATDWIKALQRIHDRIDVILKRAGYQPLSISNDRGGVRGLVAAHSLIENTPLIPEAPLFPLFFTFPLPIHRLTRYSSKSFRMNH